MTQQELKKVKVGDTLIEGNNHEIVVEQLLVDPNNPDRVTYFENGYFHEVNCEYLSFKDS